MGTVHALSEARARKRAQRLARVCRCGRPVPLGRSRCWRCRLDIEEALDSAPPPPRHWTVRCLVCRKLVKARYGHRYCRKHERERELIAYQETVTITTHASRYREAEFQELDQETVILQAAASIRILRPDGTEDVARTAIERQRWLERKLHVGALKKHAA